MHRSRFEGHSRVKINHFSTFKALPFRKKEKTHKKEENRAKKGVCHTENTLCVGVLFSLNGSPKSVINFTKLDG